MKVVLQRVKRAEVKVEEEVVAQISHGLLLFVAIHRDDLRGVIAPAVDKLLSLRIFHDSSGKMMQSVQDVGGEVLVVSQFTLLANCSKGRRPDFLSAAPPEKARELCAFFSEEVRQRLGKVQEGVFGAHMEISLVNDGPVTLDLEFVQNPGKTNPVFF